MVKRASELRSGVLTQCLKMKTVDLASGVRMSTIHNILMKINTKLRGINHYIPTAIRYDGKIISVCCILPIVIIL